MYVAQVLWDFKCSGRFHIGCCGFYAEVSGIALWRAREIGGGLCEDYARFGHSDELNGLHGGDGDGQSPGIRITYVFRCQDNQSSCDESRIFAGIQHLGQPVQGCIGIGAAHAFDKGGDSVVVLIFIMVVKHGFLLD